MTTAIRVALAGRAYDVLIGAGLTAQAGDLAAPFLKRRRVAIVADDTVMRLHGGQLVAAFARCGIESPVIAVPSGEASKCFAELERVTDELLALELDRGDLIAAFGGGVVGDLAGFAASIYKRGVDFIQIPTTLLAQVDSSVGGKTAIDSPRGKNLIGAFHQPVLVLADLSLLDTLPDREMRAGYAEVIKYAFLGDADFLTWLEANGGKVLARDPQALNHAVAHCSILATPSATPWKPRSALGRRCFTARLWRWVAPRPSGFPPPWAFVRLLTPPGRRPPSPPPAFPLAWPRSPMAGPSPPTGCSPTWPTTKRPKAET